MIEGEVGRNLLDLPYPKVPARRAFHLLRHRRHSFQRLLGRRPVTHLSVSILSISLLGKSVEREMSGCLNDR